MADIDRAAPLRFLQTAFEPEDWAAIFLKSYETNCVAQRVGPVSWVQSERFLRWLRAMNSQDYSVFVSVNAITAGRRSRTRDVIGAVRHVFLDADDDGVAVLSRVAVRRDLPPPSYVLHTSANHIHLFWRVTAFDGDLVERLQKQLARELGTDPAATPVTQNTRLPGFFNHKRAASPRHYRVSEHGRSLWARRLSARKGGGSGASTNRTKRVAGIRSADHRAGDPRRFKTRGGSTPR